VVWLLSFIAGAGYLGPESGRILVVLDMTVEPGLA
jgi:hypothetical protein